MELTALIKSLGKRLPGPPHESTLRYIAGILAAEAKAKSGPENDPDQIENLLHNWTEELSTGKPLQYVLGKAWFMNFELQVGPEVLIPRPETEELVELLLSKEKGTPTVLDACTGSGCIAIGVKAALPGATVYATDVSESALRIAKINSQKLNLAIHLLHHDLNQSMTGLPCSLDILVSNPPYIDINEKDEVHSSVIDFEPETALFAPADDPLHFYRRLKVLAQEAVRSGGRIYLEVNQKLAASTAELYNSPDFTETKILKDISGNDRFVITTRC